MEDMKLQHARKHGRISTMTYTQTFEGNVLRRKQVFRNETRIQLKGDKRRRHLATLLHPHVKDDQQTKL